MPWPRFKWRSPLNTKVSNIDLEMAEKLGYTILLLGISNIKNKIIQLRTHPCLILKIQY